MDFQHPVVQSVAIPLALAVALTGVLRFSLGEVRGKVLAATASGIALLAATLLILGVPPWPPRSGPEKLPLILAAGLGLGVALDLLRSPRIVRTGAGVTLVLLACAWIVWPQVERLTAANATVLGVAALAACVIIARTNGGQTPSVSMPAMLVVAGLGLAAVAFNAGSLKLFQLSLALASALGGYALWNWPRPRYPFGAAGILGAVVGWLVLALLTLLLTPVRPVAVLLLALVFAAGELASHIPLGRLERRVVEPLLIVLLAAIPAVAAALFAHPAASADDLYYH